MVQKSDIEFNGMRNTDEGNLEVTFFAKKGSSVLKGDTLAGAVMVRSFSTYKTLCSTVRGLIKGTPFYKSHIENG